MIKYCSVAIFLFIISCKKEKTDYNVPCNLPTTEKITSISLFQGSWTWVSELHQDHINGQLILITPLSEGYTRQLVFRNDTELNFFKNNNLVSKYLYDITPEKEITLFPTDTANVLVFKIYATGLYSEYVHFNVCNDTLILNFQITTDFKGKEKWVKTNKK